jgi:thiol-disulfide isomerase/thioredoxin
MMVAALSGCDDAASSPPPPPAPSRFEAVTAAAPKQDELAGFCDVRAEAGQGKPFSLPAVDGAAPTGLGQAHPLWLNLWATWCKPCIEEMPMIVRWQKQLASEGKAVDLAFVSVDEDAAVVPTFRAEHPGVPESMHIADPKALAAVVAGLGLDPGAGLPIHVFVEPGSHIRCVRAGAVTESHHAVVTGLLR